MAEDQNENRFGGQYMVQDRDHMGEIPQVADKVNRGGVRQPEQSQAEGRQHGSGEHSASGQQGGGRRQSR